MGYKVKKVLLEFFITSTNIYTFIIRPDWPEKDIADEEPIVLCEDLSENQIKHVIQKIKGDFEEIKKAAVIGRPSNFINDYDLEVFHELGSLIFTKDLMKYIEDFDAIYLVPYGDLHYLPLHAMKYRGQYIIDQFQIAYLPSASVLQYLQLNYKEQSKEHQVLLAGVDYTGEHSEFFTREVSQIQGLPHWQFKENTISLKQEECTLEAFLNHCEYKSIIHLSSHGRFVEEDPLSSGALLYEESEGFDMNIPEEEYILSAKTIFEKVKLNADLFVMSGCVTGDSENKAGDELIGLTRALMYAGAKTMIVSLFETQKQVTASKDNSTLQFANFYKHWLGRDLTKGAAFQKFIQEIKANKRFSHPYFWFPFILVGNLE